MIVLAPDLMLVGDAFRTGLALECDAETGRITRVAPRAEFPSDVVTELTGRALLPGFVNAHSHSFQRLIRGRTQRRLAQSDPADFWSWRDAMYATALRLSPDDVYHAAHFCFIEMLRAGITSVGEFHYLHNDVDGSAYADPAELARRVLAAARDAGIRIRLLHTCYARGGIDRALGEEQRRFATVDLDAFANIVETLAAEHSSDDASSSIGVAPHSLRAVPLDWLQPLQSLAARYDLPLHMHVAEQPAEVEACVDALGLRPVELLDVKGLLDGRFTAVHATHITDAEVRLIGSSDATVCACPTTERDLGDGVLRGHDLLAAGAPIALGSDSQTVIDMLEEARLVEYHERLLRQRRLVLAHAVHGTRDVAALLLHMTTVAGARSLRLRTGALEAGAFGDVVAIDLDHPALAGASEDTLAATLMLSAPADVVRDVWVGGRAVVTDRRHDGQEDAMREFERVARSVREA